MRVAARPVVTLRMFHLLSEADAPLTSAELARRCDVSSRRVRGCLAPLLSLGWAAQERGRDGVYRYRARWLTDPGWLGSAAIVVGGRR